MTPWLWPSTQSTENLGAETAERWCQGWEAETGSRSLTKKESNTEGHHLQLLGDRSKAQRSCHPL